VFRASRKTRRSSRGRASRATCSGDADTRRGRARRGRQRRRRLRREGLVAPDAGQRACSRVPPGLPSGTRAAGSRLPINAFIGPGTFMSRCASLRGGTPLASGPRCARPSTEPKALLNRRGRAVRPVRARATKGLARRANQGRVRLRAQACSVHAPHAYVPRKATWLAAAAFGRGGKALAVRMRRFRSVVCARPLARRARPPRGHAPASAEPGAARAVPARGSDSRNVTRLQRPRRRRARRFFPALPGATARAVASA
jgi:hypothetical protein